MEFAIEQFITAISKGGLYASLALALVMTYKATGQVNFAQGEMATISTFVAWTAVSHGMPVWLAIAAALAFSAVMGFGLERWLIRPFRQQPVSVVVTVTVGLFIALNSIAGWIWGYTARPFPSPFSDGTLALGETLKVRWHTLGAMAVSVAVLVLMFLFFRFTRTGLAMRGAAANPASGRLLGIAVDRMRGFGWALASAVGAIAGIMMAPFTFLDPHMMSGPLIFFFAAALLGGISSPPGAVVGGYAIGLVEMLAANLIPSGNELRTTVALVVIVAVLVLRPQGLLGKLEVHRV